MLTAKQQRFVEEYVIDLNATQAAIRAGYSERAAAEQGSRLLTYAKIKEKVAELQANTSQRLNITKETIINEYLEIIESAKREGEFGPDRTNWNKALAQLSKLLGFEERQKIDITTNNESLNTIKIEIIKSNEGNKS
jgi:phage terminase small subunit